MAAHGGIGPLGSALGLRLKLDDMMPIPRLDLHHLRHHEVENEVVRFLERHLRSGFILEIITGNSEVMMEKSIKIIQQYGLQYHTGAPRYTGRIVVITYDDLH